MSDAKLSIGPARFLRTLLIGIAITVGLILAVGAAQGADRRRCWRASCT